MNNDVGAFNLKIKLISDSQLLSPTMLYTLHVDYIAESPAHTRRIAWLCLRVGPQTPMVGPRNSSQITLVALG